MRILSIAAAVLLALVFAVAAADPAGAQALKKVRVGSVGASAVNWPVFVAQQKDFFKAEGVEVEITYVGNVANTVQQLVAGAFDIGNSTFDSAIRAIAKGGSAVMIGGMTTKYPYSIMVAPSVQKVGDLKGKRIVLPFPKDLLTIVWNRWVREQGMQPADIDQLYDGATPNRFNALAAGTVQAALLTQPFDFRAAASGYKRLLDIGAYGREYGFLTILGNPKWLQTDPAAARAYLRAIAKATDWLYDQGNRAEAITLLTKYTKVNEAVAGQTYDYYIRDLHPFSRKAALPMDIVQHTLKTLVEIGDISPAEAQRSGSKMADLRFLPK
ncbi:MAG: PhnD/SsuA/transferrin family substrate-binding protein [Rhizobiales bacterium]|nr:PhnD/SsuA/transferrin family substrate-binding protein [Hyphomicrobiales bacterium]